MSLAERIGASLGILAVLFIYLIFADYIFFDLIRFDEESRLIAYDSSMTADYSIMFWADRSTINRIRWKDMLYVDGWAFVNHEYTENFYTNVLLRSYPENNVYVFNAREFQEGTWNRIRHDVVGVHGDAARSWAYRGFYANIPLHHLKDGVYEMGMHFRNVHTGQEIYRIRDVIEISDNTVTRLPSLPISEPPPNNNVLFISEAVYFSESTQLEVSDNHRAFIDFAGVVEGGYIEIAGWSFVNSTNNANAERFVLLTADSGSYIFTTENVARYDVRAYFADSGDYLEHSGFTMRIPSESLPSSVQFSVSIIQQASSNRYFVRDIKVIYID